MNGVKDYTTIILWDGGKSFIEKVFYKDFQKFEHLPEACQSEETRREFLEYQNWMREKHDCSLHDV